MNYTVAYFYSEGNPFGIVFLILLILFQLSKLIVSHILDNRQFDSVEVETSFTNKRQNRIKHFVYDSLMDLPSSNFVLMLDKGTDLVSPAVYTKQNNRISMINRNAEYTAFELTVSISVRLSTEKKLSTSSTLQSALTASPISNASNSSMQCAYWSCGMGNGMVATPYSGWLGLLRTA